MPKSVDRFLRRRTGASRNAAALGRVFHVTRETWSLTDDPQVVPPTTDLLVSGRTAADAADLAREAARVFPSHGFHKPSGAWWGADDVLFHRFVVHAGKRRSGGAILLLSSLAGLLALGLVSQRRRGPSARDKVARKAHTSARDPRRPRPPRA
jgi:hypothetical protein